MTDEATADKLALASLSQVTSYVGQLQSVTATGYTVVISTGAVPAFPGSGYMPAIGEDVIVWFIDGTAFVMGPATPNPGRGTVVSVASGMVTLSTALGPVVTEYASTLSPTAGQLMRIEWGDGPFAMAVSSTSPPPPTPPPTPGTGTSTHVDKFTALDSGSYRSGWWTPQVRAGSTNQGAWFFGSKINDTLPASASIQSVQIYISPIQISGSAPLFATHAYQTKPGGAPAFGPTTAVAVGPGWVNLPTAFGDALKSGGGAAGVGVNHGGDSIFNATGADGLSGALLITSVY